jgi:hypothetical protein
MMSIVLSGAWLVAGLIVFVVWAKHNASWPFAPVEVREAYLGSN